MTERNFHVTYFYLATGMEGRADRRDYGIVSARTSREAIRKVASRECKSVNDAHWMEGCLTAKEVT